MSKGFIVLAQNINSYDYVKMAYALAMSLHLSQEDSVNISIVTNDKLEPPQREVFDKIIEIPWGDNSTSRWKAENRWKLYHASPYDETIVLDVDMLVLKDLSSYWKTFDNYDIYFTSKVIDYRGNPITDDFYRKTFTANKLPSLYSGLHYFKKSSTAQTFYEWIELVSNNWELFYGKFVSELYTGYLSMDITVSLVAKILDCENTITNVRNDPVNFVHMKPRIQNWREPTEHWRDAVGVYFDDHGRLKIGNYQQNAVFHYTEKEFLTDNIVKTLEILWNQ